MNEVTLGAIDQRSLSNERRIGELAQAIETMRKEHSDDMDALREENKAIYELAGSVKVIAERMDGMSTVIVDTNEKVENIAAAQKKSEEKMNKKMAELENKPAKEAQEKMKKIETEIILTIVGVLTGGALTALIGILTQHP